MIKCLICNKDLGMLTESHVRNIHKISCYEYAQKFNLKKGELNPHHSKKMIGKNNPRYRAIVSQATRYKIKQIHKNNGTFKGLKNPMYGKKHKKEVPDAKLDYPIITDDTVYFADIGIPSLKLDIEYDGSYWHNKLKDDLRDMIIKSIGWKIVRIKEKEFSEIMIYPGLLDYITNYLIQYH